MIRTRFIPHDQDREDQKVEDKAERRALRNAPVEDEDEDDSEARFGGLDYNHADYASTDTLAEALLDDDETEFDCWQLACLNKRTGVPVRLLRRALEGYGFTLRHRPVLREVRGFKSNPHNRYEGNPMAGGGGGSSIYGMAS